MSHIFDSKLHQSEFYVYENYVVYLHVRSCSPYSHLQTITIWLPGRWAQASLATTNRCNHVYVVLFFILLFMYAVIHCLYSVGNKITTTTTTSIKFQGHTGQNITDFDPNWAFPDYRPVAAFKSLRFALFKVIRQISRSHGSKNRRIWPRLGVSGL